jgi:tetratricopeptide (TPR) repeat protein
VAAVAAALAPMTSRAACTLETFEIPIRMIDSRPIATLGLNGTQVPMLLDSGAFFSLLTESIASQLHLPHMSLPHGMTVEGFTGRLDASLTRVDKVQFLKGEISRVQFIVGVNEVGGGAMGVLGRNFLSLLDTEYDLAHGVVRLVNPSRDCTESNLAYWAGDTPVIVAPLESTWNKDTAIRVTTRINGKAVKAILDTGASETSIDLPAAHRAGIADAAMTPGERVGGGGAGHARSWTAKVDSFELEGERITHNLLQVTDTRKDDDTDMLIGLDYFLSHRIYVARSQQKLYATWNGGPVFGRNTVDAASAGSQAAAASAAESPATADALARRGAASATRGDLAHALEDFDRACALEPRNASHFEGRARVYLAMQRPAEALEDLDEALRLDPTVADARLRRAQLRAVSGDRDGALQDLATLDATLPPAANLRAAMADTYAALDMPKDAIRQWASWMPTHEHEGSIDEVLNHRCWTRMLFDIELDEALADCRRAVDSDPDRADYQDSLGWIRLRRGEFSKAIAAFNRSLALKPASAWSLYGRSLAYLRSNDKTQAEADLGAARKIDARVDDQLRRHGLAVD